MACASKKIVMVTGGNSGIGFEVVKALLTSTKASYHVLMSSRSLEKAKHAINKLQSEVKTSNTVEAVQVDLTSDKSIERAFEHVKASHDRLDVLVNNAGASFDPAYHYDSSITLRACFTLAYDTNVAGTHVLTYTFMPLLLRSSDPRLLFITGLANQTLATASYFPTPAIPAGWPKPRNYLETIGYRCSKTALNMLMLDWNHKLKADGVKVWAVGPGFLETDLGGRRDLAREMGAGDASIGGEFIREVVEGERDEDVGKIIVKDGVRAP